MSPIVIIYAQLVKDGVKTIEQVPTHIKKEVETLLNAGEPNA